MSDRYIPCIHTNNNEREKNAAEKLKITTALFQLSNDSSERNGANKEEEEEIEAEYTQQNELCAHNNESDVKERDRDRIKAQASAYTY